MILVVGEILFDIFPDSKRLGGAPFNFACHLKRLGLPVRFVSRVGNDTLGGEILEHVAKIGFDPEDIQVDRTHPTGTVRVQLDRRGVPTFDIIANVAYDYITFQPEIHMRQMGRASLLYFGTLVQRTNRGFRQMQRILERKKPGCMAFYDVNLRANSFFPGAIEHSLDHTEILKLNTDELSQLSHMLGNCCEENTFIRELMAAYRLKFLALTKGEKGSALFTQDDVFTAEPSPVEALVDTVGAGDAFAAVLAAGIVMDRPIRDILSAATDFSAYICGQPGAIPEHTDVYAAVLQQIGGVQS